MSYQTFTNELCQLWSYWTKVYKMFTRHRGIIYAVNVNTELAISHSVGMATSLEISEKRGPDRSSAPQKLSFGEKIAKISPADHEIIVL